VRKWLAVILLVAFYAPGAAAEAPVFHGLLRGRDLTPFGYLRLDMRPGFSPTQESRTWEFETDLAYQNTWATSPEVEKYLNSLASRRELGPAEWQAIRDLPGENYLLDLESSQFDVTVNYQISPEWGAYTILSAVRFGGGFLDGTIEKFHELTDNPTFGRPAASRNDTNLLFDLKGGQYVAFESPAHGGLLDPVFGVRYTKALDDERWRLSLESAIKVPLGKRDPMLSTGRADTGVQMSLQRLGRRQAFYLNVSAVYYAGMRSFVPESSQVVPTFVVGYERRMTPRTNVVLQAYLSRNVYTREQTDLNELLGTKYQLSAGIHHRRGSQLITFAITENIQNINNTPDVGFQLGWSINPGW
jgi:hypothetical protein